LEKPIVAQLGKKITTFYGTEMFNAVYSIHTTGGVKFVKYISNK
jgi:hypothetical protein